MEQQAHDGGDGGQSRISRGFIGGKSVNVIFPRKFQICFDELLQKSTHVVSNGPNGLAGKTFSNVLGSAGSISFDAD